MQNLWHPHRVTGELERVEKKKSIFLWNCVSLLVHLDRQPRYMGCITLESVRLA